MSTPHVGTGTTSALVCGNRACRKLTGTDERTFLASGTGLCDNCAAARLNGLYLSSAGREWLATWWERLLHAIETTD